MRYVGTGRDLSVHGNNQENKEEYRKIKCSFFAVIRHDFGIFLFLYFGKIDFKNIICYLQFVGTGRDLSVHRNNQENKEEYRKINCSFFAVIRHDWSIFSILNFWEY